MQQLAGLFLQEHVRQPDGLERPPPHLVARGVDLLFQPPDVLPVLLVLPPVPQHLLAPVADGGVVDVALEEPLRDPPPRVELLHRRDGADLQLVRAHPARLVDDVMTVVHLPVVVDDVLLTLRVEGVPVRRAGDRRHDHELHGVDVVLAGEADRLVDRLQIVLVRADHEHAVDRDVVRVEPVDRPLDLRDVLLLVEQLERPRVDRLEADVHVEAVRVPHELEQLGVIDGLGPDLRPPLRREAAIDHPAEQLLHPLLVGGEDVVGEERVEAALVQRQLVEHPADRVGAEGVPVHARDRAERAGERAPPGGRDRDHSARLPARDERVVGDGVHVEVGNLRALGVVDEPAGVVEVREVLDLLEPLAALDGVDQLQEGELALSAHDVVRVPDRLLRQEGHVGAAQHREDPRLADRVRQPVRLRRRRRDGRDRDQIGREHFVHVDRVDVLDVHAHVEPPVTHDRPEEHRAEPWDGNAAVDVQMRGLGLHEHEFLE